MKLYIYCNERYFTSIHNNNNDEKKKKTQQTNKNKNKKQTNYTYTYNYICPVVFRPGGVKNQY